MEVSGTPCGNGPVKSRVNGQSQLSVKQPLRAARSLPARRAMRTPATAALVGTEMSNGASSPDPSEMAVDTRSGRRRASALTKCPPRLWPIRDTGRPDACAAAFSRRSSRVTDRSEQSTFITMPDRWGSYPSRRSHPRITASEASPARKPGTSSTAEPSPRGTPRHR